jgi:tRNA-Thr(GGU) m(6)t(6)A37 methyltransferase TsaA
MSIDMTPIGLVRSSLCDRRDAPRQAFEGAPKATLEIDPAFAPALHRITSGTELIVVTWLHEADRSVLQVHPMDDERIPLTGVFATRSSDRPNPIGLHRVTVIGTHPPTSLHVNALEAIDGTPILDLKVAMKEAPDAEA